MADTRSTQSIQILVQETGKLKWFQRNDTEVKSHIVAPRKEIFIMAHEKHA